MHEAFENFDFKKEDYINLNTLEKQKIKAFVNTKILFIKTKTVAQISVRPVLLIKFTL
jgi:hypothetical protein